MEKSDIIQQIKLTDGVADVEELEYKPGFTVLRFFYEYDDDELEAAREYADSESTDDTDEDTWYNEYYKPFIIDLAVDEVRDTIEDMVENGGINAEYISYEPEKDDESLEFIAVFADEGIEFEIDDILDSLNL